MLKTPFGNNRGQGLTEYLILLMLISVVCIAGAKALGNTVKAKIEEARNQINSEVTFRGGNDSGGDGGGGILESIGHAIGGSR
jgi:Flp pilus assembly pilin Flp